jgi:hypothetical protein
LSLFRPSTAASGRRRPKTRRQFKAQDKTEDTAYFRQGFRLGFVELQDNPVGI